ncbi:hypothetical protein [Stutzerimonas kunmingensis]|uniref:hypothetical protein n=1 Tax=Stutzerimonas kunmingensis TaxID=1211807 RepID=UPI0028B072E1|nr:hypothetical protein [Stutzerimonas kunmingensis]
MPTLGWIQETGLDRFWERGSEPGVSALPNSYACRYCGQLFESLAIREQHELEHPLYNPTLFFRDRELGTTCLRISTPLQHGDFDALNVNRLTLNNQPIGSVVELVDHLQATKHGLFSLAYANDALVKHLKIDVCIADPQHLTEVEQAFKLHFACGSTADTLLTAFYASVQNHKTVGRYVDGLVRYLHGLRAKDHLSDITSYEDFDKRFNQSLDSLKDYNTPLAAAVRAVIRFNRNDFAVMQAPSGLPELDRAIAFFNGTDIAVCSPSEPDAQLPVDQATEFILTTLMPVFAGSTFIEFENSVACLPMKFRSQQDTSKLNYLCWRKAVAVGDQSGLDKYRRKLRHDDVFNTLI